MRSKSNLGFSFIEALIAMAILMVCLTGTLSAFHAIMGVLLKTHWQMNQFVDSLNQEACQRAKATCL